ncbi:MAG: hypothetical protein ACJA16_004926 [Akkermansiaceae bacterium]|jgi:hypothetical protein
MLTGHPGGQMLEMADGISDEEVGGTIRKIPDKGCVRGGLTRNHGRFV